MNRIVAKHDNDGIQEFYFGTKDNLFRFHYYVYITMENNVFVLINNKCIKILFSKENKDLKFENKIACKAAKYFSRKLYEYYPELFEGMEI